MGDSELRGYAEYLIQEAAQNIEFLSVSEGSEDYFGEQLTEDELDRVYDFVYEASVTVRWNR